MIAVVAASTSAMQVLQPPVLVCIARSLYARKTKPCRNVRALSVSRITATTRHGGQNRLAGNHHRTGMLRRHDGDVWRCAFPSGRVPALPTKSARPGISYPRHAGAGRYPRLALLQRMQVVDTGLRRHDGGAPSVGQSLRPLVLGAGHIPRRRRRMLRPPDDRRGMDCEATHARSRGDRLTEARS